MAITRSAATWELQPMTMTEPLTIEVPFSGDPKRLVRGIVERAKSVGAHVEIDSSGLAGTFFLKRLFVVWADGTFALSPHSPGVARIRLNRRPPMMSDANVRHEIGKVFAELQATTTA